MFPKEIHDDFIKTVWDESLSHSTVMKWAAEFRRGVESMDDYKRPGRPEEATSDENVEIVHRLIMCDRRRSLCDIIRQTGICFGAIHSILNDRHV